MTERKRFLLTRVAAELARRGECLPPMASLSAWHDDWASVAPVETMPHDVQVVRLTEYCLDAATIEARAEAHRHEPLGSDLIAERTDIYPTDLASLNRAAEEARG